MSWILEMQIKEDDHWESTEYEYNSRAKAEAAGVAAKLCGLCEYYEIYHS